MQKVKAVVFDMDGVIFDSERLVIECWKEIADKYQVPDIEAACHECLGVNATETRQKFLNRYGQDFPYDDYKKEMSALFHGRYDDGRLPMKVGIVELLQYLKQEGVKVALASSTRSAVVTQELTDVHIIQYFDAVIGGDMVTRSKPQPDIFLKACEALGVAPTEAIAIEDSYNGIRAAAAGKLIPIMVPDLMPPTEQMQELAEEIFENLFVVKEYLEKNH